MRGKKFGHRPIFVLSQTEKHSDDGKELKWAKVFEASWKPIAAIAVPVAVAVSPAIYKYYTFDRGVDGIIAEQALQLLRADPDIDGDEGVSDAEMAVRDWAIDVVERYSQVSFPQSARDLLRQTASDPEGPLSRSWLDLFENRVPCEPQSDISYARAETSEGSYARALLEVAVAEARNGITEFCAPERVLRYFRESVPWFEPSASTDWAAAFVGWVISQTGNPMQLDSLGPGVRHIWWSAQEKGLVYDDFSNLRVGDLVVWVRPTSPGAEIQSLREDVTSREMDVWGGHIGFVSSLSDTSMVIIGGNQSNAVSANTYPRDPAARLGTLVPLGYIRLE